MRARFITSPLPVLIGSSRCCSCILLLIIFNVAVIDRAYSALPQGNPPDINEDLRGDLEYHAANLRQANDANLRTRAARFLLRMQIPQAEKLLDESLRSGEPELVDAVINALRIEPITPPALIDGIALTLNGATPEMRETIATILARYGELGSDKIAALALDEQLAIDIRLGAVRALGELRGSKTARRSVDTLITIISISSEQQSPKLADAAFESLNRLTSLNRFGKDAKRWQEWWDRNRSNPVAEWLPDEFQLISERLEAAQQEIVTIREDRNAHRSKIDELLGEVYFLYLQEKTEDELQQKLATWLKDPLLAVRRNALRRIDTRAANNDLVADAVVGRVVECLGDVSPEIRQSAAGLLDRLNFADTGSVVAAALSDETHDATQLAFLEVLRRRPAVEAIDLYHELLESNPMRDAAAGAMLAVLKSDPELEDAERDRIHKSARQAFEAEKSEATVRLLAYVADDRDAQELIALLQSSGGEFRQTVAMAVRRFPAARTVLNEEANDPHIFPAVVANRLEDEATIDNFLAFTQLQPTNHRNTTLWKNGLEKLTEQLPIAELPIANNAIRDLPTDVIDESSRLNLHDKLFVRVFESDPSTIAPGPRRALLLDLVRLRLQQDRGTDAMQVLDLIAREMPEAGSDNTGNDGNGESSSNPVIAEMTSLRFRAHLRLKQFEKAAAIETTPSEWIDALREMVVHDSRHADAVRAEIERRFPDLEEGDRSELRRLTLQLPGNASGSEVTQVDDSVD